MWLEAICAASAGLVVHHHIGYPLALKALTARMKDSACPSVGIGPPTLPPTTLIVPVYNEARFIEDKIANCAELAYPEGRLTVVIVCDGCADSTPDLARAAIARLGARGRKFRLVEHAKNRGKIAVLNEAIAAVGGGLVALSDASARLAPDALTRAAAHFAEAGVGFVSGAYDIGGADPRQRAYWSYQVAVKSMEARLGSPIGAHGAFYMFRRGPWRPLEPDTINDDVVLPMRIVELGFHGVYDRSIAIAEAERDTLKLDMTRRLRLAAGAVQQTLRLWRLADPRRPGLAFAFVSGKALRAFTPFLMLAALASNMALAGSSPIWTAMLAAQLALYAAGAAGLVNARAARLPGVGPLSYLVAGHAIGLAGAARYFLGLCNRPWTRMEVGAAADGPLPPPPLGAIVGKRALDIVIASLALVALCALFIPIAAAIRLESRGPIFYRQLRVGLRTAKCSRLFYLTKFRTMRVDAESASGAVWATEHDPRVTRVGRFLRKSRLDELPQCVDVLRGDMSVVGPRPERPQFFNKLESAIPYYAERTYGLKPGITGLAQVTLPYDSSIEDVRAKVLHDHAYALRLFAPGRWLATDASIILRTFAVMVLGKGR